MSTKQIFPRIGASERFARVLFALGLLFSAGVHAQAAAGVKAYKGTIDLPTYPWTAVKHPYFQGTDKVNIYPYPMLDFLSREKTNCTYRTVILENDYLRITFLPELGGKIHEVIDKTVGKPMFYVNHVVKPGLIGQCGAWTSGGVEWNTGPQGHTVSCMQPIPVLILPREKDGSQSVAIGETERIYGTRWTVVVTLRPGRSFIEERIRIYNPTENIRPYYFWNCTAAPNTPGFRFIYPMTLGCDHAGEKFFRWPIDSGKDLSRGTNYEDASSIFAWHCDQDFFGSYNDDLDHGAVSFADHYQLPGKKAWTWGYGGFGKMHQMDLTDDDGPYNEVQTGPLLTQAQVGRLDPCQAVEWKEWWYPVHGIGGFTFANNNVAVNARVNGKSLRLQLMGTREWSPVEIRISNNHGSQTVGKCKISPRDASELQFPVSYTDPTEVTLVADESVLARFSVPLNLPAREPPIKKTQSPDSSALLASAWEDILFARFGEAEDKFGKVLKEDSKSVEAEMGLAFLNLDRNPEEAAVKAASALETDPNNGLANLACAVAQARLHKPTQALDCAWAASRSGATAVSGRALAAKLLFVSGKWDSAAEALAGPGPWETDVTCAGLRSYALLLGGDKKTAVELARANLQIEPLNAFSRSVLWLANSEEASFRLKDLIDGDVEAVLLLADGYNQLHQPQIARRILQAFYFDLVPLSSGHTLAESYDLALSLAIQGPAGRDLFETYKRSKSKPVRGIWPWNYQQLEMLVTNDVSSLVYRANLLFHLRRHSEAREMWKQAAQAGIEPVIACRALGMAAKTLDGDLEAAREWLEKANASDPEDSIVARDLANVLLALADKCDSENQRTELLQLARNRLKGAFREGRGRSDFIALLARAQNRLGNFSENANMLDSVRVTVWEGAHDVHDLFEQAHLALGDAYLKEGRAKEALAEFNRALEYPPNLATGKLENAREANIQFQRGNALAALGRNQEAAIAWKLAADEPESREPRINEARQKAIEALKNIHP